MKALFCFLLYIERENNLERTWRYRPSSPFCCCCCSCLAMKKVHWWKRPSNLFWQWQKMPCFVKPQNRRPFLFLFIKLPPIRLSERWVAGRLPRRVRRYIFFKTCILIDNWVVTLAGQLSSVVTHTQQTKKKPLDYIRIAASGVL